MIEFAALPMLISLVAAAIPYLLLRNRIRTKKTVYWSANRLLEQAVKSQARKMDWLRWLLLALRTLALVCLALAVANPFWRLNASQTKSQGASAALHCFVIDCSPSMALKQSDQPDSPTRFELAKRAVSNEIALLGKYDLVCVATLSDSLQVQYFGSSSDENSLNRVLNELNLSAMSVRLAGTEAVIDQMIVQARQRSPSLHDVNVKILSDYSVFDWSPDALDGLSKQLSARKDGVVVQTEYQSEPLSADEKNPASVRNLTLCKLSYQDAIADESTGKLVADISNTGTAATNATTVQLWIDNQLHATQELAALQAGESSTVEFPITRSADSDLKIEVRLPDDQLVMDNVAFHVVQRDLPGTAVLIGRDESAAIGLSTAYKSLGASASVFSSLESAAIPPTRQDIHLIDPVALDAPTLNRLSQLASDGNHVFVWMGSALPVSSLEQLNTIDLPASQYAVADWPTNDLVPILENGKSESDDEAKAFTLPLSKYWRVSSLHPGWQTKLELGNGESFALQRSVGSGSVTWITTPPVLAAANDSAQLWNAMARWPSFIPIVDFLRRSAARTTQRNYLVGQDINFVALTNSDLKIVRPDQTKLVQHTSEQTNLALKANQIGWYFVEGSKALSSPATSFASNLDCHEINFNPIDLPSTLKAATGTSGDLPQSNHSRLSIFRIFLTICIVFLLVEMVVTSVVAVRRA